MHVDGVRLPTFKPGFYVWEAAPVAAIAMMEELKKARYKRQLIQPEWREALYKAADLVKCCLQVMIVGEKTCMSH